MRSPPTIKEVVIEEVVRFVDRPQVIEVVRPHNCILPLPVEASELKTADVLIAYLNKEYRLKYQTCLKSLGEKE